MTRIYEDMAYGDAPVADSFWATTASPMDLPRAEGDLTCDTLIIGMGYTGLNAALALAEAGQDVIVVDAHGPGWGASGRNGGFCCLGGSGRDAASIRKIAGDAAGQAYFNTERAAIDHVEGLLDRHGIDVDRHSQGETMMAHRAKHVPALHQMAEEMQALHGLDCQFIARSDLADHGMNSPEFHGALTTPVGFALNPMKYVLGLARAVESAGARLFSRSFVTGLSQENGRHLAQTDHGQITAKNLIIATNGYSSETLPKWLAGRYLPVQTNILVTRPLLSEEIEAQGWTSGQMCYDTRHLLHYFRLLPDNRMLFGQRGAMRTTPVAAAKFRERSRADFERFFPEWARIETPYYWSGLVALARELMPFAGPVPGMDRCWSALCYHGNGVAMGSYSGAMLADQILGGPKGLTPELMQRPLARFGLGRFRRAVLPLVYGLYGLADR